MNPESNMVYGILSWETWREYLVLGVGRSNNYRIPHPRGKTPRGNPALQNTLQSSQSCR
jgi:hypothetical protein